MTTDHEPTTYQQPAAPAPPAPQFAAQPLPSRTNPLAIASLICSFFIGLLGVIFGIASLAQIRRSKESGRGLAIAGIIIGGLELLIGAIIVASVVLAAVAVGNAASSAAADFTLPSASAGSGSGSGSSVACTEAATILSDGSADLSTAAIAGPQRMLEKLTALSAKLAQAGSDVDDVNDVKLPAAIGRAQSEVALVSAIVKPYTDGSISTGFSVTPAIQDHLTSITTALKGIQTVCDAR